jgi:hypothetical protein
MTRKIPGKTNNTIHSAYNDKGEMVDLSNNLLDISNNISYVKINFTGINIDKQFIISICNLDKILLHTWYLNSSGYPFSYTARYKSLHRHLLGRQEKGMVIDHINRNKFDNRLSNLRVITAKENSYNRTKNANSNNKYKGVCKRGKKYVAVISKDGVKKEIGGFLTEEDAAKCYDMMAEELFKEFAGKNFT